MRSRKRRKPIGSATTTTTTTTTTARKAFVAFAVVCVLQSFLTEAFVCGPGGASLKREPTFLQSATPQPDPPEEAARTRFAKNPRQSLRWVVQSVERTGKGDPSVQPPSDELVLSLNQLSKGKSIPSLPFRIPDSLNSQLVGSSNATRGVGGKPRAGGASN